MESYQQPHHHYNMRPPQQQLQPQPQPPPPPPPSLSSDPHFSHQYQHQHPPPPPPSNSWFSTQFQYHPSHSPPPPPPPQQQQNQWGPPPPPPPPPQYPAHPHQSYPAQPYPPPPPPPPPRPSPPPYSHQDWTNANWSHQSGWEYPAHANEEDWAAKARAWASARSAMENQHPQTQFMPVVRQEEPSHYVNQYAQPVESHYQDVQQTSNPTSGFQNYQGPAAPMNRPPMSHQQEPASISSYAPDAQFSFAAKDGALGGDMNTAFPRHQGSTSTLVHQQEVPSSYSSVPAGQDNGSMGQQHGRSLHPADSRSIPMDHAPFAYRNHSMNPMDQPLEFAPRFSHEIDPKMNSYPDSSGPVRGTESVSAVSSLHAWTGPVAPGTSYPPVTPAFPLAPQHDPSIGVPPLPGQPAPLFGRGTSFQNAVPSISAPVGLGAGSSLHPIAAFSADTYGGPLGSDRPKKAAVPNWLREEIIKNKATITSSTPEPFKDESESNEDEMIGKSTSKVDQTDSKSVDSARSPEEEDDDEDYEEAQRTATINQEIKRVLTEVLLKVTDELFDEIATKVLNEDDLSADAMANLENHVPIHKGSPTRPPVPTLKASTKVLIPVKGKESEGHGSGESSSGTTGAGNVLGLANYASDDDDVIQTLSAPKSDGIVVNSAGENGHRQPEAGDLRKNLVATEGGRSKGSSTGSEGDHDTPASTLSDRRIAKDLDDKVQKTSSRGAVSLSKKEDGVINDGKSIVKSDASKSTDNGRKTTSSAPDVPTEKGHVRKSAKDDSQERDPKRRDRHESKRKDDYKEIESGKERENEKEETRVRRDEKRQKKDKTEDYHISRERSKEQDDKHGEKARESDSRRRSPHLEDKDSKKERERDKKRSRKDDADKKREKTKDEKGDKSRHKSSSDASRHKRRRSSSATRVRKNEASAVVSGGSDDEASDDSKRKDHSKRRNLSPSPVRSRRRYVLSAFCHPWSSVPVGEWIYYQDKLKEGGTKIKSPYPGIV
ncbi:hypothetical protein BVRB_6g148260 isoform B [Beta vulgaris subsp. vulgaris]|nr:hypothetical protein BVRB_6g148260 isoform B [Beta vulgaris subsp. vulgaris]